MKWFWKDSNTAAKTENGKITHQFVVHPGQAVNVRLPNETINVINNGTGRGIYVTQNGTGTWTPNVIINPKYKDMSYEEMQIQRAIDEAVKELA